jgi:HK97 family phage major capsid protein
MADVAYPGATGMTGVTEAATFIPELWSDEIVAAYKKNLNMSNLVNKMSMVGKKGDTLHIPKPTRGSAAAKAENTAVTIQADTESEVTVSINKHYEYSRMIEDIVGVQALDSMRRFYTDDAGYALAKQVDDDLFTLGKSVGDGDGSSWVTSNSYYIDGTSGLSTYAADTVTTADVFTDAGFRDLIKLMDDADVPMEGRFLIVPPSARRDILGISRYNSSDFVDGRSTQTGLIGNLYGIDIYVSSNCPTIETAAENSADGAVKAGILGHRDTFVLAEQMGVRSQTQYKQEYLADLFTADTLYGTQVLRPETGFVLAMPA